MIEKEPRIRELSKRIEAALEQAAEPLRELFEEVYEGKLSEEYEAILSELVLITLCDLPVAEMKYKRVGE